MGACSGISPSCCPRTGCCQLSIPGSAQPASRCGPCCELALLLSLLHRVLLSAPMTSPARSGLCGQSVSDVPVIAPC